MALRKTAGDLQIVKGQTLAQIHKVEDFLGEGGFGFVTKCRNTKTNKDEAIKVNKSHPEIIKQAVEEIAVLKKLRHLDPDTCNIVRWNGFFFDRHHICLNFELLDQSLYAYMRDRDYDALPVTQLRPVIHQLSTALHHLSSIGLVHADVKPDNIMVVNRMETPLRVKLIDFGLACPASAVVPGVCVQTTWYRAPEVMLHILFNEAIDMWSLGLVAVELATGYPLYPGDMEYDVLRYIIETQGQPEDNVLDRGMGTEYYFHRQNNGQRRWRFKSPEEFAEETGFYPIEREGINQRCLDDLEPLVKSHYHSEQRLFVDLVKRMLELDSDQRIKPLEALQHPFFAENLTQNSDTDAHIMTTGPEEQIPGISVQPSYSQVTAPENICCRIQSLPASLADTPEETSKEASVKPENKPGWFRQFMRGITDAFHQYFF